MKILLIEDDKEHCEKYEKCASYLPFNVELSIVNGLKQAFILLEKNQPDIILLDLELNESDGDGILFLQKLKNINPNHSLYIIVITNNCSYKTHKIARNFGADYIFMKTKPDYSPHLVFDFAYKCFVSQPILEKEKVNIETIIIREIEKIGFTQGTDGYNYLIDSVTAVIYSDKTNPSLKNEIYPFIAKKYKKGDWCIDRAIGTAITKTWRITDTETLQENYTMNVDYGTGIPTNKQMILYLADKIKKEYAEYI